VKTQIAVCKLTRIASAGTVKLEFVAYLSNDLKKREKEPLVHQVVNASPHSFYNPRAMKASIVLLSRHLSLMGGC
jgi:hypothetical protein